MQAVLLTFAAIVGLSLLPLQFENAVNYRLGTLGHPGIRLVWVTAVPDPFPFPGAPRFHARHAATCRSYVYRLILSAQRNTGTVFEKDRVWHIRYPIDVGKLQAALALFEGVHDFAAFQGSGCTAPSSVRSVSEARVEVENTQWHDVVARSPAPQILPHASADTVAAAAAAAAAVVGESAAAGSSSSSAATVTAAASPPAQDLLLSRRSAEIGSTTLSIHISSRSFLYHQVRHMVGAAVAVGSGRWQLDQLAEALSVDSIKAKNDEKERAKMAKMKQFVGIQSAPPTGLFLHRVEYPYDLYDWSKRDVPAKRFNNSNAAAASSAEASVAAAGSASEMELDDQEPDSPGAAQP